MRIAILGVGVVGRVYGAKLAASGHDVTMISRGRNADDVRTGLNVVDVAGNRTSASVEVADGPTGGSFDFLFVCVRRDQIDEALNVAARVDAGRAVLMTNCPLGLDRVLSGLGSDRAIPAFPGIGGFRENDGTVSYLEIAAQKTTVGSSDGRETAVVDLIRSIGLSVETCADMDGWLKTHAVFVAGVGASILRHDGDVVALAGSGRDVRRMVKAVGEGFRALTASGVDVAPTALRAIFTIAPTVFAVPYWQKQLRGPIGTISLGPHVRATAGTEFAALRSDVQHMMHGDWPTPALDDLLRV